MRYLEWLDAYTALTHTVKPDSYRVSKDGTKLWVMVYGMLACLEGEALDKMTPDELHTWHLPKLSEWKRENHI